MSVPPSHSIALGRYHLAAWLHPALLSLTLAKPCHNPHFTPALHSSALAAPAHKSKRNAPLPF
jgi:hypothetical protein